VAASATQPDSTASATVQGDGRRPATSSVNAASSAPEGSGEPVHEEPVRGAGGKGHAGLSRAKTHTWPLTWHFALATPLCDIR
jgi:hypothetical protein